MELLTNFHHWDIPWYRAAWEESHTHHTVRFPIKFTSWIVNFVVSVSKLGKPLGISPRTSDCRSPTQSAAPLR